MKKLLFIVPVLFFLTSCTNSVPPKSPSSGDTPKSVSSTPKENRTILTPSYGSGKNLIEIFADFQCPACQNFTKTFEPLLIELANEGTIRIEYRQFPLPMHKNAYRDAMAALCGAEQGKYMEAKSAIYALEISKKESPVTDANRVDILSTIWIDTTELKKCLDTDRYLAQVDRDIKLWESRRVNSTPTVFLDGKKIDNSLFRDPSTFKFNLQRIINP